MRIWHYELLKYLPDAQFKGQLRELVAILHDWRNKGKTNHLLINNVMEYSKSDLSSYAWNYFKEYQHRYNNYNKSLLEEFVAFAEDSNFNPYPFNGWHNKTYLRVCMANLYEKHIFGIGKSRITDEEWAILREGYYTITGEAYRI